MLELGISQAQTQFTQLLNQSVLIIDKKAHMIVGCCKFYQKTI